MQFTSISVVGLGYIGLPTAAIFASHKIKVIGLDINKNAIDLINQGKIHIVEPELDIAVNAAVTAGFLKATTIAEPADAFIVAVPTPFKGDNHEADLSFIESACRSIAPVLTKGNLVILESTSPVGATEEMSAWLANLRPDLSFPQIAGENSDIRVAYCPERVLPGHVMRELVENDRIIGGLTAKCSDYAVALYKKFVQGACIVSNARTAEMAKLTENSFRDVNIAFANELSMICDDLGINVWELIQLANRHPRVNILQPGSGVGGHCIAVDPWFIVSKSPEKAHLIRTAREVNDSKPKWVIEKVKLAIADLLQENPNKTVRDISIACYGLAFKADIDDLRESPSMQIALHIKDLHAGEVFFVEPNIEQNHQDVKLNNLKCFEEVIDKSDIHIMLVDHKEFKVKKPNSGKIIDLKGIWL